MCCPPTANPNLPSRSTGQLLAAVSYPKQAGFSGTVVEKASFGLPDLSSLGITTDGAVPGTSPLSLLSGSHTIRVWYGSPTKQRIALLDTFGELDLFRNGNSLWQWNSDTRTAVHRSLPSSTGLFQAPGQLPDLSPDQAAQHILAMVQPSTAVTTDRTAVVAGRSAYVLALSPKQAGSRIRQVRISVDGQTPWCRSACRCTSGTPPGRCWTSRSPGSTRQRRARTTSTGRRPPE